MEFAIECNCLVALILFAADLIVERRARREEARRERRR
jgi:hypothetical protein